jgi:hypothetical protein
MEQTHDSGSVLLGMTMGFWLMQKFFFLAQAMTLAHMASVATIFSGLCAGSYWLYSLYKKYKNDRADEKNK